MRCGSNVADPLWLPAFGCETAEQWELAKLQQETEPLDYQVRSSVKFDDLSFNDSIFDSDGSKDIPIC